jgi:hypothetical protein
MSFRNDILGLVDNLMGLLGPTGFDITLYKVDVKLRTWSGQHKGFGTFTDTLVASLPQHSKVRNIRSDEIQSSGGLYRVNDVVVEHVTPSDGALIGFTEDQLHPHVAIGANNVERIYILTGPPPTNHIAEYDHVTLLAYSPFEFQLVLRRRATTP